MKKLITLLLAAALITSAPLMARWGQGWGGWQGGQQNQTTANLTIAEEQHLTFMREEEKLARDVYIVFSQMYPRSRAFGRIDDSEQKHTDAVKKLLDKYDVVDPSTNDNVGVFTGAEYSEYFTEKFNEFVTKGEMSVLDAMYVGAFIEELDMIDINYCNQQILDANVELYTRDDCGLKSTDRADVQRTLNNLLNGSRNHLRAYVNQIERHIGYGNYEAQLLPQEEVDEILGR